MSSFIKISGSVDGKKILATQINENSNIFVANETNLNQLKQITSGNTNNDGQNSLSWFDEKSLIFSSQKENSWADNLWLTDLESKSPKQLTEDTKFTANNPNSDGKSIYFHSNRTQNVNIFKTTAEGGNLETVTNGADGSRRSPQISADGNWLYYIFRNRSTGNVKRLNLLNQTEETVFEHPTIQPGLVLIISPDEKYLAFPNWRNRTNTDDSKFNAEIAVVSTINKEDVRFIQVLMIPEILRFSPDSKAIEYISETGDETQIMRQEFDEKESKPILMLPKEKIFNFAWSKSGRQLAISRGQQIRDAVLLTDFDK